MTRAYHLQLRHHGALTVIVTNKSGGSLAIGDVVIVDTGNDTAVTTTTTAQSTKQIGVVAEPIANNATGHVAIAGYVSLVNTTGSVTRGHYAETSTTVKKATNNSTRQSGSFAQFLTGGTTPAAWLYGVPDSSTGGGGGGGSMTVEFLDASSPEASVDTLRIGNFTVNGAGDVSLLPQIIGTGTGVLSFDDATGTISLYSDNAWNTGDGGSLFVYDTDVQVNVRHTNADIANTGFHIMVGTTQVGLYISEKDATTLQIYDDNNGAYDILFEEQSDNHHFQFKAAEGGIAEPAMGMFPIYSSAPHVGFEVEGEGYYDTTLHKARVWNGSSWNNLF